MGIFKTKEQKNNQTKEVENKVKDKKKKQFRVYIKDIYGSNTKKVSHFDVERYIDEDNSTVWLLNNDSAFKEVMPEDTDDYKLYKLQEVKDKIIAIEDKLSNKSSTKTKKKDNDKQINKKNLQYELGLYKNYKRSLELQGRGSYLNYDEDGMPYFVFRRKGNFKFPEFDNVELDTIYTPSETQIKEASELLDMKKQKYSKFAQNLTTIVFTFFIIEMLFLCGLGYWSFKLMNVADESAIAQMQERIDEAGLFCAEKYGMAGKNFYESSLYVKNITETLAEDLHKETAIIQGVKPD